MWTNILDFVLGFLSHIGEFSNWLFTPFADGSNPNSALGWQILYRWFGITLDWRPIDLLNVSIIGVIVVFCLIKIVNIFS